ncbi:DUF861 domain-containing protein [Rhodococcus erythropolis]|nr:DUF861 domain-containing protein [Rhodococcus erythropolis]MQP34795.1 DUF861 domain-containing protein [Rhodococcus erythropolis]OHF24933.1 hypothetical protein BKP30_27400 [Rhodococcus erythropolis]
MPSLVLVPSEEVRGDLEPKGRRAGADRGDPQVALRLLDTLGRGNVGIWECEPGGWAIPNRVDTEASYLLAGAVDVTDDSTGITRRISAGDYILMPKGWSGRWDVVETVRKVYAIY